MKLSVELEHFRPLRSNTLHGFVTIIIPELHLKIIDCPVHEKNGKRWISMPGKVQITKDGTVRRDEHGKIMYAPVLEFTDRETRDAFSARVIDALLARFPGAFGEVAA
jgi:hypothetical protein